MTNHSQPPIYINEYFHATRVTAADMDKLWANGWRHFGSYFFRYNLTVMGDEPKAIIALRTDLAAVQLSKSQRRNWRRNSDLTVNIQPVIVDEAKETLFNLHRQRFDEHIPEHIYTFLSLEPDKVPCPCYEVGVYSTDGRLLAVSFMDVGEEAISSVYALFDPYEAQRGLGIFTMLLEIKWAQAHGKRYYYTGYTTTTSSRYDYKKCFYGLSYYDFLTYWRPFPRQCS